MSVKTLTTDAVLYQLLSHRKQFEQERAERERNRAFFLAAFPFWKRKQREGK